MGAIHDPIKVCRSGAKINATPPTIDVVNQQNATVRVRGSTNISDQ